MAAGAPLGGGRFIADKSVWARTGSAQPFQSEWQDALAAGQILTCPITVMELLYSARSHKEFVELETELRGLASIPIGAAEFETAIAALRKLSAVSDKNHRVPIPDALIAACAEHAGVGVLHYDKDFDKLASVLSFESRWIVPRGSIP